MKTPGLWSRVQSTLAASPTAMTSRDVANQLGVQTCEVSSMLHRYAQYGRVARVVQRDNPLLHWRLLDRDPRRDPRCGDALRRGTETRAVTGVAIANSGALVRVEGVRGLFWRAKSWRTWAEKADVIARGAP